MKPFLNEEFMLTNETAKILYHKYAEHMPILDYHCHINPAEIAEDRQFETITQVWLGGDHYKWRIMRANGVEERYITGDASDWEKFEKWAQTLEKAIGNPLYHWSHLELRNYFGYDGVLNGRTARKVYDLCNEKLRQKDHSVRNLIINSGVTLLCTTDDPVDDLRYHDQIKADSTFPVQVLPAWRPDKAMNLEKPEYLDYLAKLETASGVSIRSFADLKEALTKRMAFFAEKGCLVSDHGIESVMYYPADEETVEAIFAKRLAGETISRQEQLMFKTAFLLFVGASYAKLGWVMQLHYGCKRDNNTMMYQKLGPDTGYDCVNNDAPAAQTADFLNALAVQDALPKTILYSLNPQDNVTLQTIMGCFQEGPTVGKLQHGSAWWFNDHKLGMVDQLSTLASQGVLGNFVGMLTDSRSFLSYARHEYFRRILCNLLGTWVEDGEYPWDEEVLGAMVEDISYNNAVRYFGFDLTPVHAEK